MQVWISRQHRHFLTVDEAQTSIYRCNKWHWGFKTRVMVWKPVLGVKSKPGFSNEGFKTVWAFPRLYYSWGAAASNHSAQGLWFGNRWPHTWYQVQVMFQSRVSSPSWGLIKKAYTFRVVVSRLGRGFKIVFSTRVRVSNLGVCDLSK